MHAPGGGEMLLERHSNHNKGSQWMKKTKAIGKT